MKYYLGVTDINWYNFLSAANREDVNFWRPGGKLGFKVLTPGAPFLFKLKFPVNAIGGIGFFSSHTFLPVSVAWDVFGKGNGCSSLGELQGMIAQYRLERESVNPTIGCTILTNPIFFKPGDWIPAPADWHKNMVQGHAYSTETDIGSELWQKIKLLVQSYLAGVKEEDKSQLLLETNEAAYGNSILRKVRLGQGAFRIMVTDAYSRKCAISGERTLPVLEAAHIKQYAESGPHFISNALLLRSDLHKLFDAGYLTITKSLKVEISPRIKEEFQNGKEYYKYHGAMLHTLPTRAPDYPNSQFIEWHNENIFRQ